MSPPAIQAKRPDDPGDPLAGAWGLPAVALAPGEGELDGVARAGRAKLGVTLRAGRRIGAMAGMQGGTWLRLAEYEAVITAGSPAVPQGDPAVTQYTAVPAMTGAAVPPLGRD